MLLLKTLTPWLLLAFLGQQVSLASGARKTEKAASPGVRGGNTGAVDGRGTFSNREKMQCTWASKDATDAVRLLVKCENPEARVKGGITHMSCEYSGKPQECPAYQRKPQDYWKKVTRALRKLEGKLCRDRRALVRAGPCKSAPRSAHFKLGIRASVISVQSGGPEVAPPPPPSTTSTATTACARRRADHRKTAEEYCDSSWASVCAFFLSVVQSEEDC